MKRDFDKQIKYFNLHVHMRLPLPPFGKLMPICSCDFSTPFCLKVILSNSNKISNYNNQSNYTFSKIEM
jgi:hypothetical protein